MSKSQDELDSLLAKVAPAAPKPASGGSDASSSQTPAPSVQGAATAPNAASDMFSRARNDVTTGLSNWWGSAVKGVGNFVNNLSDTVKPIAKKITDVTGDPGYLQVEFPKAFGLGGHGMTEGFLSWHHEERKKADTVGELPAPPNTNTGALIENGVQFGLGLITAGKALKVAPELEAVGSEVPLALRTGAAAVRTAVGAGKAALSELMGYDAHQERLSNMIQSMPELQNPVTKFLAADPNDSMALSKLKQGVEGILTSVPLEAFTQGLAILKKTRLLSDGDIPLKQAAEEITNIVTEADKRLNSVEMNARYKVVANPDETLSIVDTKPQPAPAEGMVRLYRGVPKGSTGPLKSTKLPSWITENSGKWFTDDLTKAKSYGDSISYVDVPKASADSWAFEGRPNEFLLPDAAIAKATPHGSSSKIIATYSNTAQANAEAGTLNMEHVEDLKVQQPGKLTPEQKDNIKVLADKYAQDPTSLSPDDLKGLVEGTNFNYLRVRGEDQAKSWLSAIGKVVQPVIDAARGGKTVTHVQLIQQLRDMFPDNDAEAMYGALEKAYGGTQKLSAHLLAGRALMYAVGNNVSKISALADANPSDSRLMLHLGESLDQLFEVAAKVKSVGTNTARALEAMKIDPADAVTGTLKNVDQTATGALEQQVAEHGAQSVAARKVLASLQGMNVDDMRVLARRLRMAGGDPTQLLRTVKSIPKEEVKAGPKTAAGLEYWMNSLLSGTKTFAVNMSSNTVAAFTRPVETWNAGRRTFLAPLLSLGTVENRPSNPALRQEGWDLMVGNFSSMVDSFKSAAKALLTDQSDIAGGDIAKSESSEHAIGGYLGTLIRTPSRMLMSADEFYKQMGYRSNVRAQLLREARDMVDTGKMTEDGVGKYVSDGLDAAFAGPGRSGSGLNKRGMDYAREVTFTTPTRVNSLANTVQNYISQHPLAKVISPFNQTPSNLLNWTWTRTPVLAKLNAGFREEIAAGGQRAALAQAKLGTGMAIWSMGATAAYMGKITGSGFMDPALRDQAKRQGHQPYSWLMADGTQHEFNRLDPFLTPWGVIADFVQASGELDDHDRTDIAAAMAASLASNLTSKTWLANATNFIDALTSGSGTEEHNFLSNQLSTLIPNVLAQTNPDDSVREVRGYMDKVLSRIPGFSQYLPPRFNIYGDPVMKPPGELNRALNPFTTMGPVKPGSMEEQLLAIGRAIPMPDTKKDGVDLTDPAFGKKGNLAAYDRMMQLIGHPKNGVNTIKTDLENLMATPVWKDMPKDADKKLDLVKNIIQAHREIAISQLRQEPEFAALDKALNQGLVTKRAKVFLGQQAAEDYVKKFFTQQ